MFRGTTYVYILALVTHKDTRRQARLDFCQAIKLLPKVNLLMATPKIVTPPTAKVDSQSTKEGSTQNPKKPRLSEVDVQILANIERSVQNPAEGPFGTGDLTWTLEFRARCRKHGRNYVVQQCYIPSMHIQDFIAGV